MDDLSRLAERPLAFILRYVRRRPLAHGGILLAVVSAAGCAVSTQYGVKFMVDTLAKGQGSNDVWLAFTLLVALMAADNFLWRVAGAGPCVHPDRAGEGGDLILAACSKWNDEGHQMSMIGMEELQNFTTNGQLHLAASTWIG